MSENAENTSAMVLLIKRSIAFADWAAGEGISPAGYGDEECVSKNPEEFLLDYSEATGDEDWSTIADRITAAYEGTRLSLPAKDAEIARLMDAVIDVIASASDIYKKRNGHLASFQDESGEKCWIVPFDAFESLRAALQTTSGGEADA